MLVGAYLDRWPQVIPIAVEERTCVRYEVDVKLHTKPLVGGMKFRVPTPGETMRFLEAARGRV